MYYNAWVSHGFSDLCSSEGNVYGRSELLFSKHPVEERSKSIYIYIFFMLIVFDIPVILTPSWIHMK